MSNTQWHIVGVQECTHSSVNMNVARCVSEQTGAYVMSGELRLGLISFLHAAPFGNMDG